MSENTLDILDDLVKRAKALGADAADAVAVDATSKGVSWRDGKLEDVDGSEGADIGLRVFFGQKQAMTSTSDRSASSLSSLVKRTVEMAQAVPEDPYCGLAPEEKLFKGSLQDLELFDATDVSADTLAEIAAQAEEAARSVEGVTNSDGAGASAGSWAISLATSHGFSGHYKGSSFSASISAVAGEGTAMERDYDFTSARHFTDLACASDVGRLAGEKAVKRLGATKLPSGQIPIVFDPRVANGLIGHLTGAISGPAIARGTSFLQDGLHQQIFNSGITIIDDPFMKRGLKSKQFDGEGVSVGSMKLIDNGMLTTWTLNSASAKQLGMETTGHASRGTSSPPGIGLSNLYIQAGDISPAEMIKDIKDGFYVTELIGMGVNGVTGDYSRGASGFRIQNGELTTPVNEVTIASNLKEMFKNMTAASDLTFKYGVNSPTLRVDGMMVAGT
ncbi:TldD/PmbA family protein [Temperatibacter marinus]|uniref:TldD/PmbA family protein n=1 Tax=Temperatibacter marinus TaxID=1456591 RepID=A0AA52H9J0_9PROT|nr:TldD/PmbA family protein [Temperatibacter marinus]WND01673.1 TldD/PmbA family protein [Temperatibacter marinus]